MMFIFRPNAEKSLITVDITYGAQGTTSLDVERIAHQFMHVSRQIYQPTKERIGDVPFIGPRDFEQLQLWNRNMPPATNRFLQELVFTRYSRQPDASAVVAWDGPWTYKELLSRSSPFAC
ncbi:hypothetical protein BDW67DRAFT_189361 [Aspergillus spinulosporus]